MALGRMDQYLWPYYNNDIQQGRLTGEQALELVCSAFMKIGELRTLFGADDVVNIAIGGVDREGKNAVNDLSRIILEAVRICNIPGPNLSARISSVTPKDFIRDCLRVIGTGIGYPALMNDDVNIASLVRRGVDISDARDYCMVGCIENFLPGKQPPWCDGRYNTPKFLELALNGGRCMLTGDLMAGGRNSLHAGAAGDIQNADGVCRAGLCAVFRQREFALQPAQLHAALCFLLLPGLRGERS